MKIVAFVQDPREISRIMQNLGLPDFRLRRAAAYSSGCASKATAGQGRAPPKIEKPPVGEPQYVPDLFPE